MKVTSVEPQITLRLRSGRRRFNIFLDDKFAFGADEDLVVDYRLIVGKEIQSEDLEKILFDAQVGKLMEKMYNLFSIRQRSEKEVRDKLRTKNYELKGKDKELISDVAIESLIEKLKKKGMLNDKEFALSWVVARRKSKNKGKSAIKSELYQKGIDRETVEDILSSTTDESEENLAIQAIEKKMRSWTDLKNQELKKKAFGFLARKGFDYDTISSVVAKINKKS